MFQSSKKKSKNKNNRIVSLARNIVYWLLSGPCFEFFGDGKYGLFWDKKLMEIWYLLVTEKFLFWTFPGWEIRSFFEAKSWWKGGAWWLLKSSYFELFADEKHGLFWGKKLMGRWYLLVTEKLLFWVFRWWELRSFLRQKVNLKMIFTDYWKVLVLGYRKVLASNFSVMENTVFC